MAAPHPVSPALRRFLVALAALLALAAGAAALSSGDVLAGEPAVQTAQAEAVIDINTASASELMSLDGIGKAKAAAIIEYREQNGPFKTVDDLTKVKGIGKKTLEKLRPAITVGAGGGGGAATNTTTPATSLGSEATKLAPSGEDVVDLDDLDAADAKIDAEASAQVGGGEPAAAVVEGKAGAFAGARININKASASELTSLKGIGKKTAEKIIEHRSTNGPFKTVDDLTKVKGIGKKTLENLRDQITVE